MGDVAAATRLLETNAADYPSAANAAFGLGRAYETGGKPREAEREYRRALALDPSHARAKAAIERLATHAAK
jgi:protein O-GlcNAc transferase